MDRRLLRYICTPKSFVFGYVGAIILLEMAFYTAKIPITTVDVIILKDQKMVHNTPTRVTVGLNISIKNPNNWDFKYTKSTAMLYSKGVVAGEAAVVERTIEAGEISAGKTRAMPIILTISADGLLGSLEKVLSNSNVLGSNMLYHTSTRICGILSIFRVFEYGMCSTSFCSFHIRNRTVGELKCAL